MTEKTKKSFLVLLVVNIFVSGLLLATMPANAWYEKEKARIIDKIFELKRKEKVEISNLVVKQKNLEVTQQSIQSYQSKLQNSQANLQTLENRLSQLNNNQQAIANSAGRRIREMYKGERISMLQMVFQAKDLNTLLDTLYYQKILAQQDKKTIEKLRSSAREISRSKMSIVYEKNDIASNLYQMNQKKHEINSSIKTSQSMINKLRTDRATYEKAQQELEYLSSRLERQIRSRKNNKMVANSKFSRPLSGSITSPFGWRRHPIFGTRRFHTGVDISNSYGTPVYASNSGTVIFSGWYGGYGKVVIVDHGNMDCGSYKGERFSTLYAHLSSISASNGAQIKKGQLVGYEGTTGYSTGPHLHFEVRINGKPNNPLSFVRI